MLMENGTNGGDWDQSGSCNRLNRLSVEQIEDLFSMKNNGTNMEPRLVNQHLYKSLKGSSFQILSITHMSEFRADAHPSTAGGKKHDDCMHCELRSTIPSHPILFLMLLFEIHIMLHPEEVTVVRTQGKFRPGFGHPSHDNERKW
ncbi:protein trichome birefringence-like 13 [Pyrus ussuriensis x Pyrus communis]|uniref:Protein trichome birefringence-like 13 n=1 Tax=Pyrus ussuriensis x Pyrus communis TaxID=2448454 RepID=A0A5N5FP72_9ROSA|nr:protein trichome birefringence-like 13 [Pyrus ussuriensis x Pyrus communis]